MRTVSIAIIAMSWTMACGVRAADLPKAGTTQILGVNIFTADPTVPELDLIENGGWTLIRQPVNWNQVETIQGQYNFDYGGQWPVSVAYDRWSVQRGKQNLFILDDVGTNAIYGARWSQAWQSGFINFAAAAATRYKNSNNIYEILNEPFVDPIDPNGVSPSQYVNFIGNVASAMRAVDPDIKIIGPAVSPLTGFAPDHLKAWFVAGLLNHIDAVSLHPYTWQGPPEQIVQMYDDVRSWMQFYGGQVKPIVSSEVGWYTTPSTNGVSYQTQADYLSRYQLINLSQGIRGSVQFSFRDNSHPDPQDPENNYGVMDTYGVPTLADAKPSYFAMKLLAESLAGKEFSTRLDNGNSSDWLLLFAAPNGDQTLAAWTTEQGGRTVDLDGWGTFQLTGSPTYLFRHVNVPEPTEAFGLVMGLGLLGLSRRRGPVSARSPDAPS
ncbi:MAG: PEP-CTERM sorting domain-containing protein [Phycisphaerales bacterium]|nr:PEP-CTERM sorting domain-containing protein [Phycisphaerales bacterium]